MGGGGGGGGRERERTMCVCMHPRDTCIDSSLVCVLISDRVKVSVCTSSFFCTGKDAR